MEGARGSLLLLLKGVGISCARSLPVWYPRGRVGAWYTGWGVGIWYN